MSAGNLTSPISQSEASPGPRTPQYSTALQSASLPRRRRPGYIHAATAGVRGGTGPSGSAESKARSSPHPSALFRPCLRPSERVPARSVPSKQPPAALKAVWTGRNGPGRARTVAIRVGTALTGTVRTGLQLTSTVNRHCRLLTRHRLLPVTRKTWERCGRMMTNSAADGIQPRLTRPQGPCEHAVYMSASRYLGATLALC